MNCVLRVCLIFSAIISLETQCFADGIGLRDVILDVCTKSDSIKSLQETVNKSRQQIREQYANALPTVSGQIFAGRGYGVGMNSREASSSGGDAFSGGSNQAVTYDSLYSILGNIFGGTLKKMYEPGDAGVYSASINLSQPIYTFGKIGTAVKVAKYYDSSNVLAYNRGIQQMQLMGFDAFYTVLLAEKSLSVLERSVARKRELSDFLTRNFSLGSGSKAQILSTKADLESLSPEIIAARQQALTAKMYLNVLMGRSADDSIELDTASMLPSLISMKIPSLEEALKSAVSDRTDIKSIDYLKKATAGGVKIFKANYLPVIAAQASAGTQSTAIDDLFKFRDYGNWQVGIGLQWQMFDGFSSSAKARQYESDARKLEIAQKAVLKYLEIEIQNALSECDAADSNLAAAYVVYDALQEAYKLTNDNFMQGDGQFAELQLAEDRLRQGELNIFNARYRQNRSRATLLVTMGRTIIPSEGK